MAVWVQYVKSMQWKDRVSYYAGTKPCMCVVASPLHPIESDHHSQQRYFLNWFFVAEKSTHVGICKLLIWYAAVFVCGHTYFFYMKWGAASPPNYKGQEMALSCTVWSSCRRATIHKAMRIENMDWRRKQWKFILFESTEQDNGWWKHTKSC